MTLSRSSRFVVACFALVSLLFMQLAMASYVCPGRPLQSEGHVMVMPTDPEQVDMVGCEGMDTVQPGLCHAYAHGDAARQFLDKPQLPDIAPFVPAALMLTLPVIDRIDSAAVTPPAASGVLTHATAPPIAIRHCCFRI